MKRGIRKELAMRTLFVADWCEVAFVHFRIDPRGLQPVIPYPLDLHHGEAFVSLVAFTQRRLRPAFGGRVAALLTAPLATHPFLNLRTYVRCGDDAAIYFIAEWIPNPLAAYLGPRTYGLPYRLAKLDYRIQPSRSIDAVVATEHASTSFKGACGDAELATAPGGSVDEFLVERYSAFAGSGARAHRFEIAHEPWRLKPMRVSNMQLDLVESALPAMRHAELIGGHWSPGVSDVRISWPMRAVAQPVCSR